MVCARLCNIIYKFVWWTRNAKTYACASIPVWLHKCLCELICLHIFRYNFYTDKECTCVSTHVFLLMAELSHFLFFLLSLQFNLPSVFFTYFFFFSFKQKTFQFYKSYRIFFPGHFGENNQPNHSMQFKTANIKINVKETEWGRKTVLQLLSSDQHFCCSRLPEW